ncbi:MAG: hypothetical protein IJ343_15685 [Clostridia bacterium]|nr:hypothetical protein [Clostridia bacterium]
MHFEFPDHESETIRSVNQVLGSLKLGRIDVKSIRGSVVTQTQYGSGAPVSRTWYELIDLCMTCTSDPDGDVYQMDAEVLDESEAPDPSQYVPMWRECHPGRIVRLLQCFGFSGGKRCFVVFHHAVRS